MPPCSVVFMLRPAFCIQKIIQVTMPTASRENVPPRISCACGSARRSRSEDGTDSQRQRDGEPMRPTSRKHVRGRSGGGRRPGCDDECGFETFSQADEECGEHRQVLRDPMGGKECLT